MILFLLCQCGPVRVTRVCRMSLWLWRSTAGHAYWKEFSKKAQAKHFWARVFSCSSAGHLWWYQAHADAPFQLRLFVLYLIGVSPSLSQPPLIILWLGINKPFCPPLAEPLCQSDIKSGKYYMKEPSDSKESSSSNSNTAAAGTPSHTNWNYRKAPLTSDTQPRLKLAFQYGSQRHDSC